MFGNPSFLPLPISMAEKNEIPMVRRGDNVPVYEAGNKSKMLHNGLDFMLENCAHVSPFKHVQITLLHTSEHCPQALSLGTSQYNF